MSEGLQKSKACNNTAAQRLSVFENDWNLEVNDTASDSGFGIKIDLVGLETTKPARINPVRYPSYPGKRISDY